MRTEEEILKDFEKLGWNIAENYVNFTLKQVKTEYGIFGQVFWYCYIFFDKDKQTYTAIANGNFTTKGYDLSIQEHKLLNELFIIWGWL